MGYDEHDAAYDDWQAEAAYDDLREEITRELKQAAIAKIRDLMLGISPTYREIVTSELLRAKQLLELDAPDNAGAFFHAYRAVDGYINAVVMGPIFETLVEPIADLFERKLNRHHVINRGFARSLRDSILPKVCTTTTISELLLSRR